MSDVQPLEGKRRVRSRSGNDRREATSSDHEGASRDWTIKSLPPETVDVSREAARRAGMKINAWVGKALEAAAANLSQPAQIARGEVRPTEDEVVQLEYSILKEIHDLKAQNESLVQTVNGISSMLIKMYSKID
jgi:hypothetical protein